MNSDNYLMRQYSQLRGKLALIPKEYREIITVALFAYLVAKFLVPAFLK